MRLPITAFVLLLGAALASSCGAPRVVDRGPRGTLRFSGEPADAILEIDETRLGPIGAFVERGVLLEPGEHRIVVRAEGFFPEYRIVLVEEDEVEIVEVSLRPVPE